MKKVVIIGPESTGKTYLSQWLAETFDSICVPEYARNHLEKNGTAYTFEDLTTIAKGQLAAEEEGKTTLLEKKNNAPLIIDTDLYVIKIWSEFVFNRCENWMLREITRRKYDLYLLCKNDIDWIKDNLREYPDLETRNVLFHHYKALLEAQHVPFLIIEGNYEQRLEMAKEAVSHLQTYG